MKHYAGLDVSVKETAICVVDDDGQVCSEMKIASHPEELSLALSGIGVHFERIGLEAGPLSQWLFEGLARAGFPVICIETRHAKAFLKAQVNKTDRNDARGIAQMMRVNLYRPVHVKTRESQQRRSLLRARKLLQEKAIAVENEIRGLLAARRKLREGFAKLHREVVEIATGDAVCMRLMTVPDVGAVTSLAFVSTIDIPARFRRSRAVGPVLGLTPVLKQSGESQRVGRVSLCGDGMMRALLYEAAQSMLTRVKKWS